MCLTSASAKKKKKTLFACSQGYTPLVLGFNSAKDIARQHFATVVEVLEVDSEISYIIAT